MGLTGLVCLLLWVSRAVVSPVNGLRSMGFPWVAHKLTQGLLNNQPFDQSIESSGRLPEPKDFDTTISGLAALQVGHQSETDESGIEGQGSRWGSSASKSTQTKQKGSSSEAGDNSEEEGASHASDGEEEQSKAERKSEVRAPEAASRADGESHTRREDKSPSKRSGMSSTPNAVAGKGSSDSVLQGSTPPAATSEGRAPPRDLSTNGTSASLKGSVDDVKAEPPLDSTQLHDAAQAHAGEILAPAEADDGSTAEKKEHKDDTSGTAAVEERVPGLDKFVVQLNFKPSLVVGRGNTDKMERHVVADRGGKKWYQVIGPHESTILRLKPAEGEGLLHREDVVEQQN